MHIYKHTYKISICDNSLYCHLNITIFSKCSVQNLYRLWTQTAYVLLWKGCNNGIYQSTTIYHVLFYHYKDVISKWWMGLWLHKSTAYNIRTNLSNIFILYNRFFDQYFFIWKKWKCQASMRIKKYYACKCLRCLVTSSSFLSKVFQYKFSKDD